MAAWNDADPGLRLLPLPDTAPLLPGSGKLGTPWDLMHAAYASVRPPLGEPLPPLCCCPPGSAVDVVAGLEVDELGVVVDGAGAVVDGDGAVVDVVEFAWSTALGAPPEQAAASRATAATAAMAGPARWSRERRRGSFLSLSSGVVSISSWTSWSRPSPRAGSLYDIGANTAVTVLRRCYAGSGILGCGRPQLGPSPS